MYAIHIDCNNNAETTPAASQAQTKWLCEPPREQLNLVRPSPIAEHHHHPLETPSFAPIPPPPPPPPPPSSVKRRSPLKTQGHATTTKSCEDGGLQQDLFVLNSDIVSHIASFLDLKSLYNFTISSHQCLAILRPDHIVRAALYQGGHAKTNLERILAMIRGPRRGSILVPSPLRMLRLCIGRHCELCRKKRVNFVSQHFGVFFCKGCLDKEGYVATLRRFDPLYSQVAHLYVIPEGCHTIKVWAQPYIDGTGEQCGPLLSLQSQVAAADEGCRASLAALSAENEARRKECLPLIERAYKYHLQPAKERLFMDQVVKYMASVAAQQKKIGRIKLAFARLSKELGNVPWKSQILAHQWVDYRHSQRLELSAPLARSILRSELCAPSRLTRARIQRLAFLLRRGVELFEEQRLHDFSFFSDASAEERALKEVCQSVYPNYSLLAKPWVTPCVLQNLRDLNPTRRITTLSGYLAFQLSIDATMDDDNDEGEE